MPPLVAAPDADVVIPVEDRAGVVWTHVGATNHPHGSAGEHGRVDRGGHRLDAARRTRSLARVPCGRGSSRHRRHRRRRGPCPDARSQLSLTGDPYVDPDTGVLVNLLGLTDAAALSRAEAEFVAIALIELDQHRSEGQYDVAHLQTVHRHLFGDVYGWAGKFRTINISRTGMFGDWRHIRTYLDEVFVDLGAENHLKGLPRPEVVARVAHYFSEVNAAHPFRDGNGRTQRAFFRQLLRDAGWSLRWSQVTADENTQASRASLNGDLRPLESLLRRVITPLA